MESPYQVMVVDDSVVVRGMLARTLEADPTIHVAVSASNGQVAVAALQRHPIDVVLLDIEMPVMDGLTALPKMLEAKPDLQVIMASTLTRRNANISLEALKRGAKDYILKPSTGGQINAAAEFKRELAEKVKALGAAARERSGQAAPQVKRSTTRTDTTANQPKIKLRSPSNLSPQAIAIGSSTGGPQALFEVLGDLARNGVTLPIVITQHMPATFTTLLAEHITRVMGRSCTEGKTGDPVIGGRVYVAPGGHHILVESSARGEVVRLTQDAPENFCRPAIDPMLRSMAATYGGRLLTVILTGMGADGRRGAEVVVAAGGTVVAQDEATSVVWGMPAAVARAGLCAAVLPLSEIGPFVRKRIVRPAA